VTATVASASNNSPALFIDRDGIVNVDRGYVCRIDQFEFVPGIFELVRFTVSSLRWPVVVVTNQSGIGRGYFDEQVFGALTERMCERFRAENAPITAVYHCPYHPIYGLGSYRYDHPWRKPRPGMILQAAKDLSIDLFGSVMVGDKLSDMLAGVAAGIGCCIRVDPRASAGVVIDPPHVVVHALAEALSILQTKDRAFPCP
jgi:D-glycero-D-manno-heptose 1,7-bisphosphate phosphatase